MAIVKNSALQCKVSLKSKYCFVQKQQQQETRVFVPTLNKHKIEQLWQLLQIETVNCTQIAMSFGCVCECEWVLYVCQQKEVTKAHKQTHTHTLAKHEFVLLCLSLLPAKSVANPPHIDDI